MFGGAPLFRQPKPIGQLALPDKGAYLEALRQSFNELALTEGGSVSRELEANLAAYHGTKHCVTVVNAAVGIVMLSQIFAKGRRGQVIMPAFSYRGLPHLVQWAGQMPRFCDVDTATHALDPVEVQRSIDEHTTSILAVCNYNSPGDIEGLSRIAAANGVPIFFDSVYAMGNTYQGVRLGGFGAAEVFSMHATKLLNGFEGGYITTNDDLLAATLRWQEHTHDTPAPMGATGLVRLEGTLNEAHAALALVAHRDIDLVIAENRDRYETYRAVLPQIKGIDLIPLDNEPHERFNFCMAVAEVGEPWPLSRDETVSLLRSEGAVISPYYSPPLHRSLHCPPGLQVPELPRAEALARRFLQLPVGGLVSSEDIHRLGDLLAFVNRHGGDIARRMRMS
jgi:dTDP-4-amino-4,6-dideoxy-D-glucose transaminase